MAAPERRRRLARATAVFAAATGLSRILGSSARSSPPTSSAFAARSTRSRWPSSSRTRCGRSSRTQALSAAFVPVFSELLAKGERARAWRVASTVFWLMLLGLGALTAIFTLVAPWVMPALCPAYDEELVVSLSRLLFPTVVLLGVSGVIVGILNSYEHFTVPALAPVAWNLAIILGVAIGVPHADSTDTKLQDLRALDPRRHGHPGAPARAMAPRARRPPPRPPRRARPGGEADLRPDGARDVGARADRLQRARRRDLRLASRRSRPPPAAINKAFRLYMLPQGIFSVAVATVLSLTLSSMAAASATAGLPPDGPSRPTADRLPARPASVAAAVLAEPIVRLVYQRGSSRRTDARRRRARRLLPRSDLQRRHADAERAFFASAPWLPTWVAVASLGVNAAFDALFYRFGVWGIRSRRPS